MVLGLVQLCSWIAKGRQSHLVFSWDSFHALHLGMETFSAWVSVPLLFRLHWCCFLLWCLILIRIIAAVLDCEISLVWSLIWQLVNRCAYNFLFLDLLFITPFLVNIWKIWSVKCLLLALAWSLWRWSWYCALATHSCPCSLPWSLSGFWFLSEKSFILILFYGPEIL